MTDGEQRPSSIRPCGPEGYDKDDVNPFIDVVGQDLTRVTDEDLDLKVASRKPDLMIAELQSQLASKRVPVSVELRAGSPVAHHRGVSASAHRPRLAAPVVAPKRFDYGGLLISGRQIMMSHNAYRVGGWTDWFGAHQPKVTGVGDADDRIVRVAHLSISTAGRYSCPYLDFEGIPS